MAWIHQYKEINRWTLKSNNVCGFVPQVRQQSAHCCYHCESLLILQDLSKQQKLRQKNVFLLFNATLIETITSCRVEILYLLGSRVRKRMCQIQYKGLIWSLCLSDEHKAALKYTMTTIIISLLLPVWVFTIQGVFIPNQHCNI